MERKKLKNKPLTSETSQQWQQEQQQIQQQQQQQQEQQRQQQQQMQQQRAKEVLHEEMIEHDIIVKMPPKGRYTMKVKGFRRKKAEPRIVLPEWL
ncbi:MAG: hypothetical protein ACUZ77_11790 [Candidatus Brocadiales bacterium]